MKLFSYIVVGLTTILLPLSLNADDVTWSWATPNYTLCEGIGLNGSYRVTVLPSITTDASGAKTLVAMNAYASGAFITPDKASLSVGIDITDGDSTRHVDLGPQPPDSIGPAPGANETHRLYLNPPQTIAIKAGTLLKFTVTVLLQTSEGTCPLGSTTKEIDPNQSPDSSTNTQKATVQRRPATSKP